MGKESVEDAIGVSLTTDLGRGRAIIVQSFVPVKATAEELDRHLDKLRKASDRQRAVYEIENDEILLREAEKSLLQRRADLADREHRYEKDKAAFQVQREDYAAQIDETERASAEEHVATGRRGNWKPPVQVARRIDAIEAQVRALKAEEAKAEEAFDADRRNYLTNIKVEEERVELLKASIAKSRAKVGE